MEKASDYTYGKILGKGSWGVVVEGKSKKTGQKVAIKISHPKTLKVKHILRREFILGQIAASKCPYVVRYYFMFEDKIPLIKGLENLYNELSVFMILEFIPGYTLSQYMDCQRKTGYSIEPREWIIFMKLLFGIMDCLHENNIAHGDMNPGNIYYNSEEKSLVMIDFGGACLINPTGYHISSMYCHPKDTRSPYVYSLPEIRRGRKTNKYPKDKELFIANDLYVLMTLGLALLDPHLHEYIVKDDLVRRRWEISALPFVDNIIKHYRKQHPEDMSSIDNIKVFLKKYINILEGGDYKNLKAIEIANNINV